MSESTLFKKNPDPRSSPDPFENIENSSAVNNNMCLI